MDHRNAGTLRAEMISPIDGSYLGELQGVDWSSLTISATYYDTVRTSASLRFAGLSWIRGSFIRIHYKPEGEEDRVIGTYAVTDDGSTTRGGAVTTTLTLSSMLYTMSADKATRPRVIGRGGVARKAMIDEFEQAGRSYRFIDDAGNYAYSEAAIYASGQSRLSRVTSYANISKARIDVDPDGCIRVEPYISPKARTPKMVLRAGKTGNIRAGVERTSDWGSVPNISAAEYTYTDKKGVKHTISAEVATDSITPRGYNVVSFKTLNEVVPASYSGVLDAARAELDSSSQATTEWKVSTGYLPLWEGDAVDFDAPGGDAFAGMHKCLVKEVTLTGPYMNMTMTLRDAGAPDNEGDGVDDLAQWLSNDKQSITGKALGTSNGRARVKVDADATTYDGSNELDLPTTANVENGDDVLIDDINGTPTVTGVYGGESGKGMDGIALVKANNNTLTVIDDDVMPGVTDIRAYMFYGNSALNTVNMSAVTSIGEHAFDGCNGIAFFSMPALKTVTTDFKTMTALRVFQADAATSIPNNMFDGLKSLQSVSLNSMSTVPRKAFIDATKLAEVSMSSASSIKESAFENCTALTDVNLGEVTSMERCAFYNCKSISSLDFPKLPVIPQAAFYHCTSLERFSAESATSIVGSTDLDWKGAFEGCTSLNEVTLGDVESIGLRAFAGCTALPRMSAPLIKTVERGTFAGCTSLTDANFPRVTAIGVDAFNGCSALSTIEHGKVTTIGTGAFRGTRLTTGDWNDVTAIGKEAFQDDKAITLVSITGAKTIGDSAFKGCTSLETVFADGAVTVGTWAFEGCSALAAADTSFSATQTVGDYAFAGCTSLKHIALPVAVTVGGNAFNGCTALEEVTLGAQVTIGAGAFAWDVSLTSFSAPHATRIGGYCFNGCTAITEIDVPEANVESHAFLDCTSLKSVNMGAQTIEDHTFQGCTSLVTVTATTAQTIADGAFLDCTSLGAVGFDNVTKVGANAFNGAEHVTSISLPICAEAGDSAFRGTLSLATVNMPALTKIGPYAFANSKLASIDADTLPALVEIGDHAFSACLSLTQARFKNATSFGVGCFDACGLLTDIYITTQEVATLAEGGLGYCPSLKSIHVPHQLMDAYKAATGWSKYANLITNA